MYRCFCESADEGDDEYSGRRLGVGVEGRES
jgi:hypothetical protein